MTETKDIDYEIKKVEDKIKELEYEVNKLKALKNPSPNDFYKEIKSINPDVNIIKKYIESGGDVNYRPSHCNRFPVGEILPPHFEIANILLDAGAKASAYFDGDLLIECISSIHSEGKVVEDFLDKVLKQIDIDEENEDGQTALFFVESAYQAKLLVERGADINHLDMKGRTPLYVATSKDRIHVAKYLFEQGAKLFIPDEIRRLI